MGKIMKKKIALVCTQGGHFEQMTNLSEFYNGYDHFWITNRNSQTESLLRDERVYYIGLAHFKKPWTYAFQIVPVVRAFLREKPTHVLSTGSGRTAFVPFLLSLLLRIKFIHIDTFSRVHGHSKFGSFLLRTGNRIYAQWEDPDHDNVVHIGPIFKQQGQCESRDDGTYVFVTVGTRDEPFARLIAGVDDLKKRNLIKEEVIIQAGHTAYRSPGIEMFDFCTAEKIDELISHAKYVITQESAGIGTQCLKRGTKFLVMPREYCYGELPTKSDMKEDLHYKLEELGYTRVVRTVGELEEAIANIDHLKTGFKFNNERAIAALQSAMEDL